MSGAKRFSVGFAGQRGWFWSFVASWFVPATMVTAYVVLALTSQTDTTGWAWMSVGLGFVLCVWWIFRLLSRAAAMSRAIAVGDADRVVELGGNSPLYRGVGFALRGEWAVARDALSRALPKTPREQVLAAATMVGVLVETGDVAQARLVLDRELAATGPLARLDPRLNAASHIAARLARGRVLTAESSYADALAVLEEIFRDIRTDPSTRALAHYYAGQASASRGEVVAAERHRASATALAPHAWFVAIAPSA